MIYKFPFWIPMLTGLVSVTFILIALKLKKKGLGRHHYIIPIIPAMFFGPLITPQIAMDTLFVDENMIEQETGIWFLPERNIKRFYYREIDTVHVTKEKSDRGMPYRNWRFSIKDGSTVDFRPGDLWTINKKMIIDQLEEKGIRVIE